MGLKFRKTESANNINQRIEILRKVSIFTEVSHQILQNIASSLIQVTVEKEHPVFFKGDQLKAMYIIVSGQVKVHDGQHIFTTLGSNDFFGEYSLIDSSVRSATVTAIERTELLRLDQTVFNKMIDSDARVAKGVLKALIQRLRNSNILEENLTKKSIQIEKQKNTLEKNKQELEELNATKDKFFTIIAHDLKNPFNTVIGLSELLMQRYDTYDEEKIKHFIENIYKFSRNAYSLLENLLQWAKSQTGRMEINIEKTDIFELVTDNLNLFRGKADNKNIKLISKVDIGTYAYIDKNMIRTVIRNLVSNAIKYTPQHGEIGIKTAVNENFIDVTVYDTGIGIPPENMDKIFKLDTNISTQGTDEEVGTGLGLIIAQEFIHKNGGKISVSSQEGKGSEFTISLPAYTN
ncbi:MAG: ATP-binding protein [Bacteroidales bacterium]|jgi:signal transduction histidine kinase|nr:ATP-binding protein [Bacteroidales bacterium]